MEHLIVSANFQLSNLYIASSPDAKRIENVNFEDQTFWEHFNN